MGQTTKFKTSDFWIRTKMDENGCLPISTISSFKRVKELTSTHELDRLEFIEEALKASQQVELIIKDKMKLIRAKQSPTKWILTDKEKINKNIPDSLLPASASSVEILGQSNQQDKQNRKVPYFLKNKLDIRGWWALIEAQTKHL